MCTASLRFRCHRHHAEATGSDAPRASESKLRKARAKQKTARIVEACGLVEESLEEICSREW